MKKININKVIKEIEENSKLGFCSMRNMKIMWTREIIRIIKKNIQEIK
jgi:hypothetical protein